MLMVLALAMTGGATLLSWLAPTVGDYQAASFPSTNPLIVQRMARDAVAVASSRRVVWSGVEILVVRGAKPLPGLALAAISAERDLHFEVDAEGRLKALKPWQEQARVADFDLIRVGMVGDIDSDHVSRTQWQALLALLSALEDRDPVDRTGLSVRLEEADSAGKAHGGQDRFEHLASLLKSEGLIG